MGNCVQWVLKTESHRNVGFADGIKDVHRYVKCADAPEEVAVMEKAAQYGADAVFFEAPRDGRPSVAQAFIYRSGDSSKENHFAQIHQKLWSWGGVPLVYRVTNGLVQLFRCAHRPDFEVNGDICVKPFDEAPLALAARVAADPWWDFDRLRNGTLWDDPDVCDKLLSSEQAAQKTLITAVKELHMRLDNESALPEQLRRKLLILSILIAYLEARKVFEDGYFSRFHRGATKFFEVLPHGRGLVRLLEDLEERFNGHVFTLSNQDRETLLTSTQLARFAELVEARQEASGQRTIWERYSFADLPVELISHVYQLFVKDTATAVYTPHFLVRLMIDEVLSKERIERLEEKDEIILDPACGSGNFLVEAYKRLVLHWRSLNNWNHPSPEVLHSLLARVHGIDLEGDAVELAAFSLCLALCDALEPEAIRKSYQLFPILKERTLHTGCFFDPRIRDKVKEGVGVIIGNPPFRSSLRSESERKAYNRYQIAYDRLPDKQLAYLFLHESMQMLAPSGALSMLQEQNFLYNQKSMPFRQKFIRRWDVREILDFVSVRGLFRKGGADPKVIAVIAEAAPPPPTRHILHATFRRSGRTDAGQGFDIDYYDMHWLQREHVLNHDETWRCDLLGGGRVQNFVSRLKTFATLRQYADERGWDCGEGWIAGKKGKRKPAAHITGRPWIPSKYLTAEGIDETKIRPVAAKLFKSYYNERRFTPPMVLIREQMDFSNVLWTKDYLTYTQQIVGVCAQNHDLDDLRAVCRWLAKFKVPLQAYVAATSPRLFGQRATALTAHDIYSLPFDKRGEMGLSPHEQILVADIVNYYRDLILVGDGSDAMKRSAGKPDMQNFNQVFTARINAVYKTIRLSPLEPYVANGVICQPYAFGRDKVNWAGANRLERGHLDALLREKRGASLNVTRIARIYDADCIYLLKPDRLRYWLRSIALRDADEVLADLWAQGF